MSVDPEETPSNPEETPLYGSVARFLSDHRRWKAPSMVTVIVWIVILVGGGVLYLSDRNATALSNHTHNISACSIRNYLTGVRNRQLQSSEDPSESPSQRLRAADSLQGIDDVINAQVTIPHKFDCTKLFKQISQGHVE